MEIKAATAELDWPIDWTLAASETISTSTWAVSPPGTLAVKSGSPAIDGATTYCILTGGTFGWFYEVTNTIVTNQGRTDARTITFRIGTAEAV